MGFLTVFLSVVFVIICLLLLTVVLLQDDQGNTVGGIFSGSSSSTFGSDAGNVLTRFTTVLGLLFMGISLFLSVTNRSRFNDEAFLDSLKTETVQEQSSFWGEESSSAPAEVVVPTEEGNN